MFSNIWEFVCWKSLKIADYVIIYGNIDIGIEYNLDSYSILAFECHDNKSFVPFDCSPYHPDGSSNIPDIINYILTRFREFWLEFTNGDLWETIIFTFLSIRKNVQCFWEKSNLYDYFRYKRDPNELVRMWLIMTGMFELPSGCINKHCRYKDYLDMFWNRIVHHFPRRISGGGGGRGDCVCRCILLRSFKVYFIMAFK